MHVWHGRSRLSQSHLLVLDSENVPPPLSCRARAVTSHPAPTCSLFCCLCFCFCLLRGFAPLGSGNPLAPPRLSGVVASSSVLTLPLRPTTFQFCLVLAAVDLQSRAPVRPTAQLDRALEPVRRSRPEPVFPSRLSSPPVSILPWPSLHTPMLRVRPGLLPILDRALQPVGSRPICIY